MKKPSFKILVYIQQFIGECMPIYPLYALMFAERGGLNNSEISLLFGVWVIVALAAEVPTGIIADKFSRKKALILGYILQGAAFVAWLAFPSFWGFALGFVVWGVGYAFMSGTFEAYLYEELKAHGQAKSFNKVYARSQSLSLVGMVVAYAGAAVIGAGSYTPALLISATLSLVAAGTIFLFPYRSKNIAGEQAPESYVGTLKTALTEVRHNKQAQAYVLALGMLTAIVGTMEEYSPLFYHQVGFSAEAIPIILGVGLLLSSALGWFAHRLERLRFATVALFVIIGGLFLYVATFGQAIGLFGMLAFMRLIMLAQTLFSATLQHHIEDGRRATITSLSSFGGCIVSLGILGLAGILFTASGNTTTYRTLAVLFVAMGLFLFVVGRKRHLRIDPLTDADAPAVPGHPI